MTRIGLVLAAIVSLEALSPTWPQHLDRPMEKPPDLRGEIWDRIRAVGGWWDLERENSSAGCRDDRAVDR
jgi:hypothetical protein